MSIYNAVTCIASIHIDGDFTDRYEHIFANCDDDSLTTFLKGLRNLFDNGKSVSETSITWRSNTITISHSWSDHETGLRTNLTLLIPTSHWAVVKDAYDRCLVNDLIWQIVNHDCTYETVERFCDRAADVASTYVYVYAGSGNDYII